MISPAELIIVPNPLYGHKYPVTQLMFSRTGSNVVVVRSGLKRDKQHSFDDDTRGSKAFGRQISYDRRNVYRHDDGRFLVFQAKYGRCRFTPHSVIFSLFALVAGHWAAGRWNYCIA